MSALSFNMFCGKCFQTISANSSSGGSVLSCGDFLCPTCAPSLISSSSCPACGKQGVRAAFLNDALPEEVKLNISDPTRELEKMHNVMAFQVKYYKQLIKRLLGRLAIMESEVQKRQNVIKELESRVQQGSKIQPFFTNKDDESRYGDFPQSFSAPPSPQLMPKQSSPHFIQKSKNESTFQWQDSQNDLANKRNHNFYQNSSMSDNEDLFNKEKRYLSKNPYLFEKTSDQQSISSTPSRVRSPNFPLVRSPSNQFNPMRGQYVSVNKHGNTISPFRSRSPISSFVQQKTHH